jgi:DnaK suppressor protein
MAKNHTTSRYSDKDLNEFQVLIEQKLEKAQQELDYMRQQIVETNESGADSQGGDWSDDSSIHAELEMLNRMVNRQQQFIRNLVNALSRIKNKTYGICSITGQLIDKQRLLLVPHATKSIAAKQAANNKRPVRKIVLKEKAEKPVEKRKASDKKIISKVVPKQKAKEGAKNIPVVAEEWEGEDEFKDVPAYENPHMDIEIDIEKLEDEEPKA